MNPEQILCVVEEAITNRPPSRTKRYHICMFEGEIQCKSTNHTYQKHEVFFVCTESKLIEGFNAKEWNEISDKIMAYMIRSNI